MKSCANKTGKVGEIDLDRKEMLGCEETNELGNA